MENSQDFLLTAMLDNAIVVTPNNRLSQQLLKNFADKYLHNRLLAKLAAKSEMQIASIAKPICLPYQNFLEYLYKELQHQHPYLEHPVLLNTYQENYLWKNILHNSNLMYPNNNLLTKLQEAWRRCRLWQLNINDYQKLGFSLTSQGKISQTLQKQVEDFLKAKNFITQANLVDYLVKFTLMHNKKIIWACFDDYTPAQQTLQQHLHNKSHQISHFDIKSLEDLTAIDEDAKKQFVSTERSIIKFQDPLVYKYQAQDINDEYLTLITWLGDKLNSGDNNIAIVMPNIETHGDYLANLIQKHLPTEHINISLGKKLTDYLLIAEALTFIMLTDDISNCDARVLLNSPFIAGSQAEFINRAELMQNLKILKQHNLKLQDLAQESQATAPQFAEILKNLYEYPQKATPHEWAMHFKNRLKALGFPGENSLSSEAYQCLNRLYDLFSEFIKFTLIKNNMEKAEACDTLVFLARQIIFQPQQNPSKISILGLLEASGCKFDAIWVTNLTDKCLPNDTNFSPFIPLQLQKDLHMPHSSHARELKFAQQLLNRLKHSCKNIVFSYPSYIDDIPMLASPLLINIKPLPKMANNHKFNQIKLIPYIQNYVIKGQSTNSIAGGTAVLANQAKCPFIAFAKNRLLATQSNFSENWPNNLERGQILHKILEELWNTLNNQQKLATITDSELNAVITKLILKVINTNKPALNSDLHNLIVVGEITRYKKLIKAALEWERARPDFQIVATEKNYDFKLNGLDFKIRIDRLDKSALTNKIIIDYKSSLPSSNPWDEERPLEPQLLLYSLLDDDVACILYLELKNGHVNAKGISKINLEIPGVKEIKEWQTAKDKWHTQLAALVTEFKEGVCMPNPSKIAICQTCDLQNLCRTG